MYQTTIPGQPDYGILKSLRSEQIFISILHKKKSLRALFAYADEDRNRLFFVLAKLWYSKNRIMEGFSENAFS